MKNKIKTLLLTGCVSLALGTSLSSCQDYLDKEPDSTVSADDAFANFRNFQGFVEEIYNCIPDKEKCNYCPSWNWGDDEIFNPEADNRMTHQVDLGNFRAWESTGNWLKRDGASTSTDKFAHGIWNHAWYCIRKCNLGLQNIDKFVTGSAEEKKLIEGQLYFFRAWWHEEMMQYFGGMPYVDTYLDANAELNLPRLSYQECADKAAADFRKAADLLPINWDKTSAGAATQGKNDLRINKIMALGYLGKTYLWAASPLMKNGAQTGASKNGKTYDYDQEYAKKAAEAFGELLSLVEAGQTQYALAEFKYKDIYNHEKSDDANSCFSDIFYTKKQNWKMPGTVEAIHDLIFIHTPQYYHWIDRKIYNYKFRRACQCADRVIAVSEYTKQEIMHYYHTPEEKIDVVYQGCDPVFAQDIESSKQEEVKQKYQLPDQYVLYVGSIEERKNLMLVAKAMAEINQMAKANEEKCNIAKIHVVAVGRRTPYVDEIQAYLKEQSIEHLFHFHHQVPYEDLPSFYKLARSFTYPSRIEGFRHPLARSHHKWHTYHRMHRVLPGRGRRTWRNLCESR